MKGWLLFMTYPLQQVASTAGVDKIFSWKLRQSTTRLGLALRGCSKMVSFVTMYIKPEKIKKKS